MVQTLARWVGEMPFDQYMAVVSLLVLLVVVAIVLLARPAAQDADGWPTGEGGFRLW